MAVVLLSTLYPAKRASQIAVPGIERRWKLPDPVDDAIDMTLPFTVTGDQALGVNAYLYEYLEAHADYSLGHFSTGDIKLQEYHSERGTGYELNLMVWLAPYDLGVSERLHLQTRPSEDEEVFEIGCVIERESGDESSWIRVTRNFINMLRKQYLLWRTFRTDIKGQYEQRGREMLAARRRHGEWLASRWMPNSRCIGISSRCPITTRKASTSRRSSAPSSSASS
jgi:hypothetical protein